jgi:hypothetical protein
MIKREKKLIGNFAGKHRQFNPIKMLSKGLQTLHEPSEHMIVGSEERIKEVSHENLHSSSNNENQYKPRSFEDEHHQNRISAIKGKMKMADPYYYNHYNTFHGSGASSTHNYLSLSHLFKSKLSTSNQSTNSSPDLNQTLMGRSKKSSSSKLTFCPESLYFRSKFLYEI